MNRSDDLKNIPFEDNFVGQDYIRQEKDKARRLRQTHWWNKKIEKGICYYCNCHVGRGQLTMDHVVPLSRGGKSKKGNIVPACKKCNNKKKYLLPIEWKEYLESLEKRSKGL
ncbi:MAG TPA: HNH endonuclease [Desulfobacteraceae bacterium]|nr:HNH endonuclease [Desulfobacteraceae bacterium]